MINAIRDMLKGKKIEMIDSKVIKADSINAEFIRNEKKNLSNNSIEEQLLYCLKQIYTDIVYSKKNRATILYFDKLDYRIIPYLEALDFKVEKYEESTIFVSV